MNKKNVIVDIEYVEEEVLGIGDKAIAYMLPKCPTCTNYPTYNINPCPFCGQLLKYPKHVKVEE
ncbi:hypothetical protein [Tepidibacter formicigenes]|uniref:Uncharacterized protein n=1 Tax=Tepidibacter formicigenes DSM 15518 TaxID=1123349 RepID=A0A1M6QJ07_9FIRM|nr:hypothetical protein [Tepidibacter formicigenes]SHK20145.1 hypothetical protein SAMN02744037_01861 [Tepidibacter formicigenes DSM 15518]